jgi:hypothetical protein
MLPDSDRDPPRLAKPSISVQVAPDVSVDLFRPVLDMGFWNTAMLWASVPKAPINEHRDSGGPKDEVSAAP